MAIRLGTRLVMGLLLASLLSGCAVSLGVPPPPPAGYVQVVGAESLHVRTCPSVKCDAITVVYNGQELQVYEYQGSWARVTVIDTGVQGWVLASYLRLP
jgi:hypothetical protein